MWRQLTPTENCRSRPSSTSRSSLEKRALSQMGSARSCKTSTRTTSVTKNLIFITNVRLKSVDAVGDDLKFSAGNRQRNAIRKHLQAHRQCQGRFLRTRLLLGLPRHSDARANWDLPGQLY